MALTVRPLDRSHHGPAFALATDVFCRRSTLHRALGVDLETYRAYLHRPFAKMLADGLSVVAVEDGAVVGCLIATDMAAMDPPADPSGPYPALAALQAHLMHAYRQRRDLSPGVAALVDMGAVADAACGRGLYTRMRLALHDLARRHGYRYVVGELSSTATQHVVLTVLGHRPVARIAFDTFTLNGTRPFRSIIDPPAIILAEGDV